MPLTDVAVRNSKPAARPFKLADGGGMYLFVQPNGAKYWRLAYRFNGKQKVLALGVYPDVTLAEARSSREVAKKTLKSGVDPISARRSEAEHRLVRQANTFEAVAREWHATKKATWTPQHGEKILSSLEKDVFPLLGARPVDEIEAPDLLVALRRIEQRGALEIASRVLGRCRKVFRYAIVTSRASRNPANDLEGALKTPARNHHASLSEAELPEFLQRLASFDGDVQTRLALTLLLLTFVRTGELRFVEWPEIDFEKEEWRIPAARMKMREMHIVPLSKQAISAFAELKKMERSKRFVFPSRTDDEKPMSENTMLFALYRMGYHTRTTAHGFRATASTILNELNYPSDWIERQLAHAERSKVRAAYNRAQYLNERRKMMQSWADFLDALAAGDKDVARKYTRG